MHPHARSLSLVFAVALFGCSGAPDIRGGAADDTDFAGADLTAGTAALLVVGGSGNAADAVVRTHLEALGLTVTLKSDSAVATADATGKRIVVISSTVNSSTIGSKFRKVGVPVLLWESALFDDMGLTAAGAFGTRTSQTSLVMKVPATDAMAAGVSGKVAVAASSTFSWGTAGKGATVVATTTAGAPAIFRYDSGAPLVGLSAPERRVAFFLGDSTAASLTDSGATLLDAAISWAARLKLLNGVTCTAGDQCRSGYCSAGICAARPIGSACTSSGDCAAGLICRQATCTASCAGDSSCPVGMVCVDAVCQKPAACAEDADCPAGQMCSGAICKVPSACDTNNACAVGQVCIGGVCQVASACIANMDCAAGQVCVGGMCQAAPCDADQACPIGLSCVSGVCR
jgi:Cys-rich repeat protein